VVSKERGNFKIATIGAKSLWIKSKGDVMRYWGFPEYVTEAEKKARAARKLKELCKKNPNMKSVVIEGSAIARTWWGKAWNLNLERYADYSNRIGRGRNYVRHGAVLDL
jgi:hypothetical protein